ncbi:B box-type domain-containing protein [Heracleum sosnowskyi]|uniref:B box-type domain-containing protein n=1 Tax=Heracleum sosnowskyi TaxID=360622 RepID=A0AAD8MF91_9APIA|nr:B box-type domain-containing protein [Heracleum sosnowskyi]
MSVHHSRSIQQEEHRFQGKPAWLDSFLSKTFFDICPVHDHCTNVRNRYCINCNLAVCQNCIASGSHNGHNILKLYRHVYKDVVSVNDMGNYIDCSKIQPYKCNKLWVFSLKPLPHKESGFQADAEHACDYCRRILSDPSLHRYCSLDCKVKAFSRKAKGSDPPFLAVRKRAAAANDDENAAVNREAEEGKRNKRKGTPLRAPLF